MRIDTHTNLKSNLLWLGLGWDIRDISAHSFREKQWGLEKERENEIVLSLVSLDFDSLYDSLKSFGEFINSKELDGKMRFIVFSFADVFKELLSSEKGKDTFSQIFAEYKGNYEMDDAFGFVEKAFMKKIENPKDLGNLIHFFRRPICTLRKRDVTEVVKWIKEVEKLKHKR